MIRISQIFRASIVFAALAAPACSIPLANGPDQAYDLNRRFPISVQPRMMTLRLLYNGQPALDFDTVGQIARFAQDYLTHGSGSLAVLPPTGNPAVADLVIAELIELGVSRNQIMIGGTTAPGPVDDIRLTFIRYVAEAPPCGDWSTNLSKTGGNTLPPNFGCATQHNIAAMVSDPRDLVAPDASGQADAQRRLTVLDKYRKGEPTAAQKAQEQNAQISVVGQGGGM
jgi:pilus assembly protein CpaD